MKKHSFKVELIRKEIIIDSVILDEGSNDFSFTSTSSVYNFPIASFKSTNQRINSLFMTFSDSDIVVVYVRKRMTDDFSILFKGEYKGKTINLDTNDLEEKELTLEINAIHSIYLLSLIELNGKKHIEEIKFKDFIEWLFKFGNIQSKYIISEKIENSILHGITKNTNAFRIFKEVCLMKNAVMTFESDNSILIETDEDNKNRLDSRNIVSFEDKDIISLKENREI